MTSDAATPDPLEAQAALASHAHDDGRPRPVPPPHQVLVAAITELGVDVAVLLSLFQAALAVLIDHGFVPPAGALTLDALDAARREVRATYAVDEALGLTDHGRAGLVEPLATVLRRSEAAHPCCGGHHPKETTP